MKRKIFLPLGTFHSYNPMDGKILGDVYTTNTGHEFEFKFIPSIDATHYEIDIISMPDYGDMPDDSHNTHRLPTNRDGIEGWRICFGDSSVVNTIKDAQKWAGTWAELTMRYILEGVPFPEGE